MAETAKGALTGKVAVITGGARNIGRMIAHYLADEGCAILVNALSDGAAAEAVAAEIVAKGGRAVAKLGDVTKEADANALAETAVAAFGRVDFLVSNAAVRNVVPFLEMSAEEWHSVLAVPLDGTFFCAKACVPHMIKAGGGAIVTMGGISAHIGTPGRVHVSAAKMGLIGFTHALAMELAPHAITVNCVAPGSIDTVRGASAGVRPNRMGASEIPLGRQGRVEEIAGTVRHLCMPDGAYITGQTIHVNGGMFLT